MKKLFNFRSFVYSAVLIMLSVLACALALNIAWLGFMLLFIVIVAPIIVSVVFRKKIADYIIVTVIMTAVLCIVSSILFMVKVYNWIPYDIVENREYYIEGTIEDCYDSDGYETVILKNLTIGHRTVSGNMSLAVYGEELDDDYIGNKFIFASALKLNKIVADSRINSSVLQSDIRYRATANFDKIRVEYMRPDILSGLNVFIKNKLIDNMGSQNGAVAYGILTGNKHGITDDIRDAFTIAGVAHILAVSGLHIGFLMALILYILKFFKVGRKPSFYISVCILILYAFIAGFSPSVTRAVIMCILGGGALIMGKQKDSLNSLGISATAILTFAPLMLFDAGFIMSMGSVFAIINFTPVFTRGLKKLELPEKLCGALSISASAQIGILPSSIILFGKFQTYSVLINVILMPVMSLAFMVLFISLLISIIPIFGFMLSISGAIIEVLIAAAGFCSTLPFAQIETYSSWLIMFLYPFYFTIGDFYNSKHKKESVLIGGIIIILFIIFLALL